MIPQRNETTAEGSAHCSVFEHRMPVPRTRETYFQNVAHFRFRSVRHYYVAVGEIECLVNAVRHHQRRCFVVPPDAQQHPL